jgi:hypothetical protein
LRRATAGPDQHLAATDHDHRMVLGVLGMEVGRFVIIELSVIAMP